MDWTVTAVQPQENYELLITFANSKCKCFDMKPYLDMAVFKPLKDVALFNTVRVSFDTVEWANGADFDPESLYANSREIS